MQKRSTAEGGCATRAFATSEFPQAIGLLPQTKKLFSSTESGANSPGFHFAAGGAAGAGLALAAAFAAGFADLAAAWTGICRDALRARFLTRLAACDRLRVFSRALSFGIGRAP
jgi:hypothetical protein